MNPWENNKVGAGTLLEYLQIARLSIETPKDELINTELEILNTMDNYDDLSSMIKEDQDSIKVGEFINIKEIQTKAQNLQELKQYLQLINTNKKNFIEKTLQTSPGNQLYVEQEHHIDFFKTIEITKDKSLLSIAYQANKIHESTLNNLQSSLSKSLVPESEKIIQAILKEKNEINDINNKY